MYSDRQWFEFTNRFSPSKEKETKENAVWECTLTTALNTNSFVHMRLGTMAK